MTEFVERNQANIESDFVDSDQTSIADGAVTGHDQASIVAADTWDDEPQAAPQPLGVVAFLGQWMLANLRYAADLILPPVCIHCHQPLASHGVLCAKCWLQINFIREPLCDRLGHPLPYGGDDEITISAAAIRRPPAYARARAVARFDGIMRDLIHAYKYADHHEAVDLFAHLLASAGAELIADADIIMPVPLHRWRLWHRRYNQAAILAVRVAQASGKPLDLNSLIRTKKTAAQATLNGAERRENMLTAFALAPGAATAIAGKRILLIDDVITTGSTLEACCHVLKAAGAREVDCLALALVGHPERD